MEKTEYLYRVQLVQEYIEKHLQEEITLKKLADVSGYSPWHFSNNSNFPHPKGVLNLENSIL